MFGNKFIYFENKIQLETERVKPNLLLYAWVSKAFVTNAFQ